MDFKKLVKKHKVDLLVILISLLIIILGTLTIGFIIPFIIVLIVDIFYFVPFLRKKLKILIKNIKKKKYSEYKHAKTHAKSTKKNKASLKESNKVTKNKTTKQKKKKKKWLKIILLLILSGIILGILAVVGFCFYIVANAPSFAPEELYVSEPSIVYDKDGKEITKLGSEKRVILEYDELPEVLIDAIVATEDSKFFSHNGVDWARFLKASALQLMGRSGAGGASTLTMQVSKNTYTSTEASGIKGIIRKFTDVYISEFKIEPNYSKEEILEFYVNSYYLGNNSYGVEQASLTYFGKSAKDLNLAEAAMIAGLFQAPSTYNPYTNPEATEKRRLTVLKLMKRHGYINETEFEIAKKMSVEKIVKQKDANSSSEVSQYQSFIDVVVTEIEEKTGDDPYTVPMQIYTTMDRDKQSYINDIMNGVTFSWENDQVQAGIAITDVNSGAIVAVGGGRNVNAAQTLNHATQIKRQIGSTAKPLYDYGPAIEYLNWSTGMPIVDEKTTYSNGTNINNWDGKFEGFETIRVALTGSRNIPALKTFQANSKSDISNFVSNLGLSPEEGLHEAHSIGGYTGESPLSMAAAYAAFANGGYYISPYSYTKIVYMEDNKEVNNIQEKKQAMKDSTAYMVSDMLVDTAKHALGRYSNINGIEYAAKTGTTNFDSKTLASLGLTNTNAINDFWVVGYNTEYAIGVWYGYDKNNSQYYNKFNSSNHTKLFQAVGKGIFTNRNNFTKPNSVSEVTIEDECPTPTLPSEYTPDSLKKTELFVKGTEPKETSSRFSKLSDPDNVKANATGNKVTITWSAVEVPKINTDSYLRSYFKDIFRSNEYLNSFISNRMNYINNTMGQFGYQIYRQDGSSLTYLGFTDQASFTTNVDGGSVTFVVKTAYSKFGSNASNGKTVTITVNNVSLEPDKEEIKEKEEKEDKENNSELITPSPTCPNGFHFNEDKDSCINNDNENTSTNPTCPVGYTFDRTSKKCK